MKAPYRLDELERETTEKALNDAGGVVATFKGEATCHLGPLARLGLYGVVHKDVGGLVHGLAGLVQLFGIESPGLTSCLALGDAVGTALAFTRHRRAHQAKQV